MRTRHVFLSFAGDDRTKAERIADELQQYGIKGLVEARDIEPGADIVLWIDRAIDESDYFVLLWSSHCVDRSWVEAEWSTAFALGLNERRSFLFVVRLDETPLPKVLAVRRYLDAFRDEDLPTVAQALATAWYSDLEAGTPVYPPDREQEVKPTDIAVLVRNKDLGDAGVTHVVVAPESTGDNLLSTVHKALKLPGSYSHLGGRLVLQFGYRLLRNGVPVSSEPLATQGITNDVVLDLVIDVEANRTEGTIGTTVFRDRGDVPPGLSDKLRRAVLQTAFKHLLP